MNVPNHRGTWCSSEVIIGSLVVIVLRKGLLIPLGTNTNMLAIIIFAFILSVSNLQFVVSHFDDQLIFSGTCNVFIKPISRIWVTSSKLWTMGKLPSNRHLYSVNNWNLFSKQSVAWRIFSGRINWSSTL